MRTFVITLTYDDERSPGGLAARQLAEVVKTMRGTPGLTVGMVSAASPSLALARAGGVLDPVFVRVINERTPAVIINNELIYALELPEIVACLAGHLPAKPHSANRAARGVMYWLINRHWRQIRIFCTTCKRVKGECRCLDRGYVFKDNAEGWRYNDCGPADLEADQFKWCIDRDSLLKLDSCEVRGYGLKAETKQRLLIVLEYVRSLHA